MKFIKTLAAVAALAAASVPAVASIKQVNNGTSELFLAVGDQNGSFILDTGVTLNDLLNNPTSFTRAVAGTAWTSYSAADTNLFDGASNSTTGTRWALFVFDGATLSDYSLMRVITTGGKNVTTTSFTFDAGTMNQANAKTGNVGQAANGTGTHAQPNGSSYNPKGTPGYATADFFRFSDANTFIGNKVGDSANLFLVTGDASDGSDPTLPVIATQLGLTASFDGQTLAVTAAVVPEPQAYALMAAGLAMVGFIARRRRAS